MLEYKNLVQTTMDIFHSLYSWLFCMFLCVLKILLLIRKILIIWKIKKVSFKKNSLLYWLLWLLLWSWRGLLIVQILIKFIQIFLIKHLVKIMNLRELFKPFKIKMKHFKLKLNKNGNIWCIFLCWFSDISIFSFKSLWMVIIGFMIHLLVIKKWKISILVKIFMTTSTYGYFMVFIFYICGLQQIRLEMDFLWKLQLVHFLNTIINLEKYRFQWLWLCLF